MGKETQIGAGFLPGENTTEGEHYWGRALLRENTTGGEHYGNMLIGTSFSKTDFQSRVA